MKHHELSYPDPDQLLQTVNQYMTAYAAKEEEEEKGRQKLRQEPDEDGFVTVTKGGRTKVANPKIAEAADGRHKKKIQGLDDFYRFQARERKKARANELLREFEQDKHKIRLLKERRRKMVSVSQSSSRDAADLV